MVYNTKQSAKNAGVWCNGSTEASDSSGVSSILTTPAKKYGRECHDHIFLLLTYRLIYCYHITVKNLLSKNIIVFLLVALIAGLIPLGLTACEEKEYERDYAKDPLTLEEIEQWTQQKCFDENGNNLPVPGPEHVHKLFGISIGENRPMSCADPLVYEDSADFSAGHAVVRGELGHVRAVGTIGRWTGYITADTAEVLMRFDGSMLDGYPFCTINPHGKGFAIYYAADRIDQVLCNQMIHFAAGKAGLKPVPYPETVLMTRRGPLVFVINFGSLTAEFPIDWKGKNIIGNALANGKITISPEDIAIIEVQKTTGKNFS